MNGKIFAWLMVLLAAFDSPGRAQDEAQRVNVCGQDAARAAGKAVARSAAFGRNLASATQARALAVYVTFPERSAYALPAIHARLDTVLPAFLAQMSLGRQSLTLETARRPAPWANLCYVADTTMQYYQTINFTDPAHLQGGKLLTSEIFRKLAADDSAFISRYDVIFFNILGDFFQGFDGFAELFLDTNWTTRYHGQGVTLDLFDDEVFLGSAAHEYGHLLGAQHPPYHRQKSFGDYEIMDQFVHRLAPFGLQNLLDIGWLPRERVQVVIDTTMTVGRDDVRAGGKVLAVVMTRRQYRIIATHHGTGADSIYAGRGLLVWHQLGDSKKLRADQFWDVESAAGLYRNGLPDPVAGADDFDLLRYEAGTARDFFRPDGAHTFGVETNPNTNFYDLGTMDAVHLPTQTMPSGVVLTNLQQTGKTISLDVLVPYQPPQFTEVESPQGVFEPSASHRVRVQLDNDYGNAQAELLHRTRNERDFHSLPMPRTSPAEERLSVFETTFLAARTATAVEYYIRVWDHQGAPVTYPPQAPDSLLRFVVQPRLEDIIAPDDLRLVLAAGDSSDMPLPFHNTGDLPMTLSTEFIPHETEHDDRALDPGTVETIAYVPRVFFDPEAQLVPEISYERAATLYFRQPEHGAAPPARLHVARDQTNLYFYFVMLHPRDPQQPFSIYFYWMKNSYASLLQLSVVYNEIIKRIEPFFNARVQVLSAANSVLPRLKITLPLSQVLASPEQTRVKFLANFWGKVQPFGAWPNAVASTQYGFLELQQAFPPIEVERTPWHLDAEEQTTRLLRVHMPARPWAENLEGDLLIRLAAPYHANYFVPLHVAAKDYRSPFAPDSADAGDPADTTPQHFALLSNYPNPFRTTTKIYFTLPQAGRVEIEVFDVLGRYIAKIVDDDFDPGNHALTIRPALERSGVYFYRVTVRSGERLLHQQTRKLLFLP